MRNYLVISFFIGTKKIHSDRGAVEWIFQKVGIFSVLFFYSKQQINKEALSQSFAKLYITIVGYNQQIDVAIRMWLTIGIRTKQQNQIWIYGL